MKKLLFVLEAKLDIHLLPRLLRRSTPPSNDRPSWCLDTNSFLDSLITLGSQPDPIFTVNRLQRTWEWSSLPFPLLLSLVTVSGVKQSQFNPYRSPFDEPRPLTDDSFLGLPLRTDTETLGKRGDRWSSMGDRRRR